MGVSGIASENTLGGCHAQCDDVAGTSDQESQQSGGYWQGSPKQVVLKNAKDGVQQRDDALLIGDGQKLDLPLVAGAAPSVSISKAPSQSVITINVPDDVGLSVSDHAATPSDKSALELPAVLEAIVSWKNRSGSGEETRSVIPLHVTVVVSLPDISQLVVRTTDLPEEQLVTVVRHVLENMLNDGQRPIQLTESIQFSTKIEMILPATCSRLGSVYLPAAEAANPDGVHITGLQLMIPADMSTCKVKNSKRDKTVGGWDTSRVYFVAAEGTHFFTGRAMAAAEALCGKQLAEKSHKPHPVELRPPYRSPLRRPVTYALGFFSGCILSLLIAFVVLISGAGEYNKRAGAGYLNSVFPVFNAMLLLLLHIYVYGLDVYVWRLKQINYSAIFDFRIGTELRIREVLLAATFLTSLTLGGMVLHLVVHAADTTGHGGPGEYIPLAVLLIWVLLFFCPFNVFWRDSRVFLLRILRNVMIAPLCTIMVADIFVGDQLTSQVTFLQEVQYCCCYYFGGHFKTRNGLACTDNGTYKRMLYVMAILPYWCRFAQCWRRYLKEGRESTHVWNAGKYLSAMLAVTVRLWYLNSASTAGLVLGVMAAAVATAYQAYWDIVVDWGLLQRHARRPWLRDRLLVKQQSLYFLAMVINVALRLAWIQSIARFNFGGWVPTPVMTLIAAALEVLRRGLWNFFRLENEHVNNVVGKFDAERQPHSIEGDINKDFVKDLEGAEV